MRVSSADWFKAGVARQHVGPISVGIAPGACTILSKLLLSLVLGGEELRGENYTPTHLTLLPRSFDVPRALLCPLVSTIRPHQCSPRDWEGGRTRTC